MLPVFLEALRAKMVGFLLELRIGDSVGVIGTGAEQRVSGGLRSQTCDGGPNPQSDAD